MSGERLPSGPAEAASAAGGTATPHGPECPCIRCTGFQEGNQFAFVEGNEVSLTHGAYATVKLAPRAAELADWIRDAAPLYSDADEPAVLLCAMALARTEAAEQALEGASVVEKLSLSADARRWQVQALRVLDALGMTPTSRGRLGLDLAQTFDAVAYGAPVEGAAARLRSKLADQVEAHVAEVRAQLAKVVPLDGVIVPLDGERRTVVADGVARAVLGAATGDVERAALSLREKLDRLLPAVKPGGKGGA